MPKKGDIINLLLGGASRVGDIWDAPEEVRREIVKDNVRRVLRRYPELREVLYRILVAEQSCEKMRPEDRERNGFNRGCCWVWWQLKIHPKKLDPLRELDIIYSCGRLRPGDRRAPLTYRLVDRGAVAEALGVDLARLQVGEPSEAVQRATEIVEGSRRGCTFELSEDAFDHIIGFDKVKKWMRRALCSRRPTHVLLYGAPGTAKTELARAVYEDLRKKGYPVKIVYVSSAGTTGQGLLEALINLPEYPTPCVLVIDEIDKVRDKKALDAVAHVMEHQQFTINKHNMDETYERNVWVIATANDITRLPPHLLDRFGVLKFYFPPYTKEQFINIVPPMLQKMFGIDPELAKYIAEKLAEVGVTSVREARELAKVAQTKEDVDELIEDFIKKRRQYWNWYSKGWRQTHP